MAPSLSGWSRLLPRIRTRYTRSPENFSSKPFGRVVLPGSHPVVGEPRAIAIPEAELHRTRPGRGCRADTRMPRTKLPLPRLRLLFRQRRGQARPEEGFAAIGPDVSVAHRSWSIPLSASRFFRFPAASNCVAGRTQPSHGRTPGASSADPATVGFCGVDSESSVADIGSSGRLTAFSSSFLSSVKICACSLPARHGDVGRPLVGRRERFAGHADEDLIHGHALAGVAGNDSTRGSNGRNPGR